LCLVAAVVADGIGGHPGAGFAGPAYHEPEYNSPPSYEFGYGVQVTNYYPFLFDKTFSFFFLSSCN
jgi:hypothetical protein